MKFPRGLLLLVCACLLSIRAWSEVRGTVEEIALQHVANAIKVYQTLHGKLPSGWSDLRSIIDLEEENRPVLTSYGFRIEDRYQFLDAGALPLRDESESSALLIRVLPFKDYRSNQTLKRALIYRSKDG